MNCHNINTNLEAPQGNSEIPKNQSQFINMSREAILKMDRRQIEAEFPELLFVFDLWKMQEMFLNIDHRAVLGCVPSLVNVRFRTRVRTNVRRYTRAHRRVPRPTFKRSAGKGGDSGGDDDSDGDSEPPPTQYSPLQNISRHFQSRHSLGSMSAGALSPRHCWRMAWRPAI